jgi:hypothetical protein
MAAEIAPISDPGYNTNFFTFQPTAFNCSRTNPWASTSRVKSFQRGIKNEWRSNADPLAVV